jgi:hypothetical protein
MGTLVRRGRHSSAFPGSAHPGLLRERPDSRSFRHTMPRVASSRAQSSRTPTPPVLAAHARCLRALAACWSIGRLPIAGPHAAGNRERRQTGRSSHNRVRRQHDRTPNTWGSQRAGETRPAFPAAARLRAKRSSQVRRTATNNVSCGPSRRPRRCSCIGRLADSSDRIPSQGCFQPSKTLLDVLDHRGVGCLFDGQRGHVWVCVGPLRDSGRTGRKVQEKYHSGFPFREPASGVSRPYR